MIEMSVIRCEMPLSYCSLMNDWFRDDGTGESEEMEERGAHDNEEEEEESRRTFSVQHQ